MDMNQFTDFEIAALTYSLESEHDSTRKNSAESEANGYWDDVATEELLKTLERLRELFRAEYERRNLHHTMFYGVVSPT